MPERGSEKNDGTAVLLGELQAALWLSESLILALLEANLLDTDTILEAIDIVIAAKKTKAGEDPEQVRAAVILGLEASLGKIIEAITEEVMSNLTPDKRNHKINSH